MTIRNITDQKAEIDSKIYDLNGHCLRKAPEKGLYIQGGKIYRPTEPIVMKEETD